MDSYEWRFTFSNKRYCLIKDDICRLGNFRNKAGEGAPVVKVTPGHLKLMGRRQEYHGN